MCTTCDVINEPFQIFGKEKDQIERERRRTFFSLGGQINQIVWLTGDA